MDRGVIFWGERPTLVCSVTGPLRWKRKSSLNRGILISMVTMPLLVLMTTDLEHSTGSSDTGALYVLLQQKDSTVVDSRKTGELTQRFCSFHNLALRQASNFYGPPGVTHDLPLELNCWYHVAVIYTVVDERTCRLSLFLDGQIVKTTTSNLPQPRDCTLQLGRYAFARTLNGCINNVFLWNVPLDASELSQLAAGRPAADSSPGAVPSTENGRDGSDSRMRLKWSDIQQNLPDFRRWVYYGLWTQGVNKYCSKEVRARVMSILILCRRTDTAFHVLAPDVIYHILKYLPIGKNSDMEESDEDSLSEYADF